MDEKLKYRKFAPASGRKDASTKYRLLSSLMDHIPDVIYFKDRYGRLVLVNKTYAQGTGLKPRQIIGKTDFDFFPKERAQRMRRDDEYVMRTGKPLIDKIERATRIDGIDNYVTTTKIPRYNESGEIVGIIGITRDITRRMQFTHLREEKTQMAKRLEALEELNKLKSEFVSVVSHELRSPLAIIKEAVGLLFEGISGPINPRQKKVLATAKDNIGRLSNIIEELLDLSRIESGHFKLHYSLVNLNEIIAGFSDYFQRMAEDKGLSFKYALPKRQLNLLIDADRITQVFINLINNAIKFTEEDGRIQVEVKVLEDKVRIGVIDTGIGIAKEDLPKLFNKFVQVAKARGKGNQGVGLGLSIVKELVQRHGGEVWAESKSGVGSKFYFTLPRFYTIEALDKDIKDRLNALFKKGLMVYLINLLIVNYKRFKQRIKIGPKRLFADLNGIIEEILKGSCRGREKLQIARRDSRNGEYSILFPEAEEKDARQLAERLKNRIKRYFAQNKAEGLFVDIGVSPYPLKTHLAQVEQLPGNVHIKRIYIGQDLRRFPRFCYKADIEVFLPEEKSELAQTVDISLGGICFISRYKLQTDARVKVKLKLHEKEKEILTSARVAWIKEVEELPEEGENKYKVGLEFIKLKGKDRQILSAFIKSISPEHKLQYRPQT